MCSIASLVTVLVAEYLTFDLRTTYSMTGRTAHSSVKMTHFQCEKFYAKIESKYFLIPNAGTELFINIL